MTETQESTLADIKKTTETDPKAADSASQGLVCNSEAEVPETSPDTDDLKLMLGDLDADAGEAPEVIECLDELDADAGDRAKAKNNARLAAALAECTAAKTKASVAQESALTSGTDVPKTVNRAAQAVAAAENTERGVPTDRALPEHEAPAPESAPPNTNEVTAAEDAAITRAEIEHLLGDLEVGAGESHEAIEWLDDQAIWDDHRRAVEAIDQGLREPDPAEPVSKVEPAATEAIGQSKMPTADPLHTGEPPECFDPIGDLKTIPKRERYSGRKGWARFQKDQRQKRWRDKKKAKAPAPIANPPRFPVEDFTLDMRRRFKSWTLSGKTHRARALQGHEDRLISALEKYLQMVRGMGRDPSYREFASRMRWSERKARRTMSVLRNLFDVGGPWHGLEESSVYIGCPGEEPLEDA